MGWEWIATIDFERLANAVVILVTGLAVGLGFRSGKKAPAERAGSSVEVATDFFDSTAIKHLTTETTGHAIAITGQAAALKEHTVAIREQTKGIEDHRRAVCDLLDEMKEMRHEMSRRR